MIRNLNEVVDNIIKSDCDPLTYALFIGVEPFEMDEWLEEVESEIETRQGKFDKSQNL